MSTYLVRLTPQEPYFFGNEKCLAFDDGNPRGQMTNRYYIKSERTPLQTTLLGAMRYIFLPEKKYNFGKEYIGEESFKIEKDFQDFGVIKKISPLFLLKGDERLIVTPFDHIKGKTTYTPFSYHKSENEPYTIITAVESDKIFSYATRVMINKNQNKKAFFKKDYVTLDKEYSFGFYLEIDGSIETDKMQTFVYLGQGKSLFSLKFEETENDIESKIKSLIGKNKVYCFGDTLANNGIYGTAKFSVVNFRDYRAYATNSKGKVEKGGTLYKLIKAGSVFISDDTSKIVCCHDNREQIGFNIMIKQEDMKNECTSL